MTIRIYVGDTNKELAMLASSYSPTAFLIDFSNYKEFLTIDYTVDVVAFTALGYLPKDLEIFYNILLKADKIIYAPPPNQWSDDQVLNNADPTTCIQGLTENMLLLISDQRPIKNIELCYLKNNLATLVDSRKTDNPQIWFAGCSITHGLGVDLNQRYGQLIADQLGVECSFLTRPGSSIQWAADQIVRSDIRANDIVIWGLTDSCRLPYIHNNEYLPGVTCWTYTTYPEVEKILPFNELFSENTLYNNICAVDRAINFCKKIQVNLGIIGVMPSIPNFLRYIKSKSEYVDFPYKIKFVNGTVVPPQKRYKDLGTDNKHPGPVQHQHYKTFILNHFDFFNQQI
jgi:hypothetical protein